MDDAESIKIAQRLPTFSNFLRYRNVVPIIFYFILFRLISNYVKTHFWLSFKGFKKYRLQNLSICWLHAVIVGGGDFILVFTHPNEMFNQVVSWWSPIAAQISLISIAYFIHDALDMLSYEWSTWTFELLLHHTATCFALATPFYEDKFLLANAWALLMEVNSIFLHARTILQICGLSKEFPKYFNIIVWLNLISFIVFRIVSQLLWTYWAIHNAFKYHWYYWSIGMSGPIIFGLINGLLLVRLLASDGFLTDSKYAMTRDTNDEANEIKEEKRNGKKKE